MCDACRNRARAILARLDDVDRRLVFDEYETVLVRKEREVQRAQDHADRHEEKVLAAKRLVERLPRDLGKVKLPEAAQKTIADLSTMLGVKVPA